MISLLKFMIGLTTYSNNAYTLHLCMGKRFVGIFLSNEFKYIMFTKEKERSKY